MVRCNSGERRIILDFRAPELRLPLYPMFWNHKSFKPKFEETELAWVLLYVTISTSDTKFRTQVSPFYYNISHKFMWVTYNTLHIVTLNYFNVYVRFDGVYTTSMVGFFAHQNHSSDMDSPVGSSPSIHTVNMQKIEFFLALNWLNECDQLSLIPFPG